MPVAPIHVRMVELTVSSEPCCTCSTLVKFIANTMEWHDESLVHCQARGATILSRSGLIENELNGLFMIERIGVAERSSRIVKHNGVAYFSGQVCEGESVAEQTQGCLDKIDALLSEAGSSREQILQATIWLADIKDFAELNEVWNAWVPEGHAPARACGEVKLARSILKVEILITAAYV